MTITQPEIQPPNHERVNLLEFIDRIQEAAASATPGKWVAPLFHGFSIGCDAAATAIGGIAEFMRREDQAHVLATQPMVTSALCRKLSEAFYLLQDSAKLALTLYDAAARAPWASDVERNAINSMLAALAIRMAEFPSIQIPTQAIEASR